MYFLPCCLCIPSFPEDTINLCAGWKQLQGAASYHTNRVSPWGNTAGPLLSASALRLVCFIGTPSKIRQSSSRSFWWHKFTFIADKSWKYGSLYSWLHRHPRHHRCTWASWHAYKGITVSINMLMVAAEAIFNEMDPTRHKYNNNNWITVTTWYFGWAHRHSYETLHP